MACPGWFQWPVLRFNVHGQGESSNEVTRSKGAAPGEQMKGIPMLILGAPEAEESPWKMSHQEDQEGFGQR